jgi:hypothetical protein
VRCFLRTQLLQFLTHLVCVGDHDTLTTKFTFHSPSAQKLPERTVVYLGMKNGGWGLLQCLQADWKNVTILYFIWYSYLIFECKMYVCTVNLSLAGEIFGDNVVS